MTVKQWEKLARAQLLPRLSDDFGANRWYVYRRPLGHLLCAVAVETATWSAEELVLHVFATPMFMPRSDVSWPYSLGKRLGGVDWTFQLQQHEGSYLLPERLIEAFASEEIPFMERHGTPERLLEERDWQDSPSLHVLETKAGALLLCGREDLARIALEQLAGIDVEYDYEHELVERAAALLRLLDEQDGSALELLQARERQTRSAMEAIGFV